MEKINVYCDESCHLEYDNSSVMVLGGVWLPANILKRTCADIREIKEKHGFSRSFEFKWTQISPKKAEFYKDIIKYFFDNDNLNFRGLIASKKNLNHNEYGQDHDSWYYKMYYYMLLNIFNKQSSYYIYIDIKEKKRGGIKTKKLHKILSTKIYDCNIIKRLQIIHSNESELLQIADLFCGALAYLNNNLKTSEAKLDIIKYISTLSGCELTRSTLPQDQKFNLFYWQGR